MSKKSLIVLTTTITVSIITVSFVHLLQVWEKERLHQNVENDLFKQKIKKDNQV